MTTTDWNWFFSSVAQSAAAIVGIFGAFIITKILANQSAYAEKSRHAKEILTLGAKLADAASRLSFERYHRHDSAGEVRRLEEILEKDSSQTPEDLYEKLHFSPYIARADAVATIARVKSNREERLEREREEARRRMEQVKSAGLASAFASLSNPAMFRTPDISIIQPNLTKERDAIDALYTEAKHHSRVVSDFYLLIASHPESSKLITISLALILTLFFAGVIYPLSFMPLPTDWKPALSLSAIPDFLFSLQGALLSVVSIIFSSMLAMFFVINVRMKYPAALLAELEEYRKLSKYSQFFANREENAAHRCAIEG